KTPGAALGHVAGNLHLAGQRKHVGEQACLGQHGVVELFLRRVCRSLLQDHGQAAEKMFEDGHGGRIHGKRHGNLFTYSTKARSTTKGPWLPLRASSKPNWRRMAQVSFSIEGLPQSMKRSLAVSSGGRPRSFGILPVSSRSVTRPLCR